MERVKKFVQLIENQKKSDVAFKFLVNEEIKTLTFGEFLNNINSFEIPKENVIGLFLSNDLEVITALFALAGKKQIVILDPYEKEESLIKKIKNTKVNKLIGNKEFEDLFKDELEKENNIDSKDILFFTSGTTSESKAVILTEESLCSATYNGGSLLPLTKRDNLLSVLPLSHVFGLVCSLLWPLSFGASVSLGNGIRQIFTDFNLYHPTVTTLVPEMAKFLSLNKLFNKELSLILIGAGSCDDITLKTIKEMGIRLSYGYGLTETSSGIALSLGDNPREMTICPDYKVRIAEDNEIIVSSNYTLMKGYYNDEEATKKTLVGNELHTGDLGKIINNKLFITGRKKEILVFGDGSKLYLPEYEAKLMEYLGNKSDFAILQNNKGQVVLYIHSPEEVNEKVDEFNKTQSRSHKIEKIIYSNDKLPRTETGKIKRYLINLGENND